MPAVPSARSIVSSRTRIQRFSYTTLLPLVFIALARVSWFDREFSRLHDLLFAVCPTNPDVEAQTHNINVRGRLPRSAGVVSVRIAERDMDAGKFFVLKNIANHAVYANVGANSELAHAIGILIGVRVSPELVAQLFVRGTAFRNPI